MQWDPDENDRIHFSVYNEKGKKKGERKKKGKKATFINQLVRQEDLLYNELPLRPTERIGNSFTKED